MILCGCRPLVESLDAFGGICVYLLACLTHTTFFSRLSAYRIVRLWSFPFLFFFFNAQSFLCQMNHTNSMCITHIIFRAVFVCFSFFFVSCFCFSSCKSNYERHFESTYCCCYGMFHRMLLLFFHSTVQFAVCACVSAAVTAAAAALCIFSGGSFFPVFYRIRGNVMPICQTILNFKMIDECKWCTRHSTHHILIHMTCTQWCKSERRVQQQFRFRAILLNYGICSNYMYV